MDAFASRRVNHMMKMLPWITACLFWLTSCSSKEEQDRKFAFDPPLHGEYNFTAKTAIFQKWEHFSPDSTFTTIDFKLECTRKDDRICTMKLVFVRVEVIQRALRFTKEKNGSFTLKQVPGLIDTLSTANRYQIPAGDPYSLTKDWQTAFRTVPGDSLRVLINRRGEILEVTGFDSIVQHSVNAAHADMRIFLQETIGTATMKDLLMQIFCYIPDKSIRQDDNWVRNILLDAKAPVKISNLVRVEKIKDNNVFLDINAEVSAVTGDGGRRYMNGKREGNIQAAQNSGVVLSADLRENLVTNTDSTSITTTRNMNISGFLHKY